MTVAAHHHLGTRAVVGREEDQRVFNGAHRLELRDHAADLLIHAVHHRGVDRHLRGLKLALSAGQLAPRHGAVYLVGPELRDVLGKRIRRPHFALHRGERVITIDDA